MSGNVFADKSDGCPYFLAPLQISRMGVRTFLLQHARDFIQSGSLDAYKNIGKFERERRAYETVVSKKHLFNNAEIRHANSYIKELARRYGVNWNG